MKTYKQLLIILFLLSIPVIAQRHSDEKSEKIKALKISFITTELSLTSDEAARFWPVYNVFDDKQFEIRHLKMRSFKDKMSDENLSKMNDKEAASLLAEMESSEDELYQIRKKFISSIKGILPPIKIIKLKKAEIDFNRKLLQQYRDKGQNK
ncbi:sensor of ECF-type sigma factor [Flavobacterium cellulosilyticum]|uniref:Sensor of ECF-type sigma factor n=1 Tax=Flavobacterium cellulosilyticum TaxID=2541731 RepID=A0A4R5C678_9FLAO|nr:sensor of ECF-type sigma factor [Flavobacterium cellulosilyticum]TDD94189.1 sensor of ECF-type sigma factor [Flavobacterium cellulosilyticum]